MPDADQGFPLVAARNQDTIYGPGGGVHWPSCGVPQLTDVPSVLKNAQVLSSDERCPPGHTPAVPSFHQ